jgi:hypothetical protein
MGREIHSFACVFARPPLAEKDSAANASAQPCREEIFGRRARQKVLRKTSVRNRLAGGRIFGIAFAKGSVDLIPVAAPDRRKLRCRPPNWFASRSGSLAVPVAFVNRGVPKNGADGLNRLLKV